MALRERGLDESYKKVWPAWLEAPFGSGRSRRFLLEKKTRSEGQGSAY
jgi:hypothetical protein